MKLLPTLKSLNFLLLSSRRGITVVANLIVFFLLGYLRLLSSRCLNEISMKTEMGTKFVLLFFPPLSGHDGCVEILLEHDHFKKFTGNQFSPLHCAV